MRKSTAWLPSRSMIRRVSPQRTTCSQAARAGTISSNTIMQDPSTPEVLLDVQKGPFGLQSRVPDCIVLRGDGAAPRRDANRGYGVLRSIVEHMWAVGQHHDDIHLGAQHDRSIRREWSSVPDSGTVRGDSYALEPIDTRVHVLAAQPEFGRSQQPSVAIAGKWA